MESLQKIYASHHKVIAIVTTPDTEKGRGLKASFSAVKTFGINKNIPVLQPANFKDTDFLAELQALSADVYVIVAFRILPKEVYSIPPFGSFNLHGSILPKFRGAAPIQWALIKGESVTGVTTFKLADKVDTGNVYMKKEIPILDSDNFATLHDKLAVLGSEAVMETLAGIESGTLELAPQDNSLATPAPKITKELCQISWQKPAQEIRNLIRGVTPFPGAFFIKNDILYKVSDVIVDSSVTLPAGEFRSSKDNLWVGCSPGCLKILEIQKEGRKRMKIEEFLRGYQI